MQSMTCHQNGTNDILKFPCNISGMTWFPGIHNKTHAVELVPLVRLRLLQQVTPGLGHVIAVAALGANVAADCALWRESSKKKTVIGLSMEQWYSICVR